MVRHQAVGVGGDLAPLPIGGEPLQVGVVVMLADKSLLPLIAPDNDMIEEARSKEARAARHAPSLLSDLSNVKIAKPDPHSPL